MIEEIVESDGVWRICFIQSEYDRRGSIAAGMTYRSDKFIVIIVVMVMMVIVVRWGQGIVVGSLISQHVLCSYS
jgi:hypothetical protein